MGTAAQVVRRELEAFNSHDPQQVLEMWSPECEKVMPGAHLRGPEEVAGYYGAFWAAFPDARLEVTSLVEEGARVAVQVRITGTHEGTLPTPGGDIPATGRRLDLPSGGEYQVEGDVVLGCQFYFDRLELLEQLGVAAAPART